MNFPGLTSLSWRAITIASMITSSCGREVLLMGRSLEGGYDVVVDYHEGGSSSIYIA